MYAEGTITPMISKSLVWWFLVITLRQQMKIGGDKFSKKRLYRSINRGELNVIKEYKCIKRREYYVF